MLKVLLYTHASTRFEIGQPQLVSYLQSVQKLELTVISDVEAFKSEYLHFEVVVLNAVLPMDLELAESLVRFVKRGGGLVCLGRSADNWAEYLPLRTAFGVAQGQRTVQTELIVRVPATANHPITRRLYAGHAHDHYAGLDMDTAFALTDSFYLAETPPREAVLLVSWQSQRLPVAWTCKVGEGFFFCTSLGANDQSLTQPVFQQLVFRAISFVTGEAEAAPIRVAMLGYGAIGFEHGTAVSQVAGLEFAAVCDRNPARLQEATRHFEGVKTYNEVEQVEADPDIDLVIISTPPNLHAPMALRMLEAGKHVVVEKPFCLTTREADMMIAKAAETGRTLTVYQCRRWDPDYLAIQEAARHDLIGDIFHLETFIGGFGHPCDYWHSDAAISGGVFYDWGSHYLDWILGLMPGQVESVSGFSHKRVWHDVTNADQSSVRLRFEGGREAEFMHSDIAAALKPKWYILGTKGAIVGNWRNETVKTRRWSGDLIEEHLAPSEALPLLTAYLRHEGGPISQQNMALPANPVWPFHRNLANHLLNGEPLAVTPHQARRNIVVMEAAKRSAAEDGRFIEVEC